MTRAHRLRDGAAMRGGMLRLSAEQLERAPLDGLQRLAAWLGCGVVVAGSEGARRHRAIQGIMATEKRLARAPRASRWELQPLAQR